MAAGLDARAASGWADMWFGKYGRVFNIAVQPLTLSQAVARMAARMTRLSASIHLVTPAYETNYGYRGQDDRDRL